MRNFNCPEIATETIRIGMIVPSSNVTMEKEVPRMLQSRNYAHCEKFSFHSSRVRMTKVDAVSLLAMNAQAERAALELADASVDAVLFACLVAIMVEGPGAHRRIEKRLSDILQDAGNPAPAITSAGALVDTLQEIGAEKIGLIAPYLPLLTSKVCGYLGQEGIEVVSSQSLAVADNEAVGQLNPSNLLRLLDNIPSHVDTIVLSACVQMPSLDAIAKAEEMTGIRVVTAAAATVYQTLKKLGMDPGIDHYGSLLRGAALLEPSFTY